MAGEEPDSRDRKSPGEHLEPQVQGAVTRVVVAREIRRDQECNPPEEANRNEDVTAFSDS